MSKERSVIEHKARAKQEVSFEGMVRHRNISPTDIDGLYDYSGNSFIYFEGKFGNKDLPFGQRRALENVCKSHCKAGNPSIAIIYSHHTPVDKPVIVRLQEVKEIYMHGKWIVPTQLLTVIAAVGIWEEHLKKMKIEI